MQTQQPLGWEPEGSHPDGSITAAEFDAFQRLIHRETGIALTPTKVALVSSRLGRRLRALQIDSFGEYYELLTSHDAGGHELRQMINCITTNKTSFFRESHHFDLLHTTILPEIERRARLGQGRRVRIWSAGCSTGEEPYSIAMTLLDHFGASAGWDARVLASDIDTAVLQRAEAGVYRLDDVDDLPRERMSRFFLRGTADHAGTLRVRPELQDLIAFRRINLIAEPWPVRATFDVIFCRNVIIYFDRETQRRLLERFAAQLRPGGYLMLGHSENLHNVTDRFEAIGATAYRLRAAGEAPTAPEPEPAAVTISIGDIRASRAPAVFRTVLGSCVAACLFDPVARVGGINHFLLPDGSDGPPSRYGVHAMPALLQALQARGARPDRVKAKVFGAVESPAASGDNAPPLQNARFVREFLDREGIPVVAEKVGGMESLEIFFETHTGRVRVRRLAQSHCRCRDDGAACLE